MNQKMKPKFYLRILLLLIIPVASITVVNAQSKNDSLAKQDLYKEIEKMDSIFFNAFNTRDQDKMKKMFSGDLEFYHDLGGLTNYDQNMNAIKNLFEKNNGLRRELVAGSLEVYPIKDYGAIQIGMHRFCHEENGITDCGTFRFLHIWQKKDGEWKITRVVSYGH